MVMPLELDEALAAQEGIERTKKVAVSEIPIIDVAPLLRSGSAADKARIGEEMREAFTRVGFCYVKNHGVPQDLIDRAFAALPAFFALPEEEKLKVKINTNQRGWLGMRRQTQIHGKKPNRSESFIFGLDLPEDDPDRKAGLPLHDTNYWPEGMPQFRADLEAYWRAMYALGPHLLRGLALAMGQPEGFFEPMYKKPDSILRCVMYPPFDPADPDAFGAGPHTDNGTLTILAQDDVGGLQLRNLDGDWIDAPSIPGTFVINVGDMIMRWTNKAFRSTPHRVISNNTKPRYSMPFFFFPDYWTRIKPLPEYTSPDNPPKFEEVVWGEYVVGQFAQAYAHFQEGKAG
jgi:isopenicillin N synthase-like dioxygenase